MYFIPSPRDFIRGEIIYQKDPSPPSKLPFFHTFTFVEYHHKHTQILPQQQDKGHSHTMESESGTSWTTLLNMKWIPLNSSKVN